MLVISTREFREKQGMYLHKAKNGEDIVLKSRENGSFKLVPVSEDDALISKEYILEPDEDMARAITGEELLKRVIPRIEKLFDK
jgi:antitoxin (DNA-binding transcriptional repressor) of toxin-antitoxin stability system